MSLGADDEWKVMHQYGNSKVYHRNADTSGATFAVVVEMGRMGTRKLGILKGADVLRFKIDIESGPKYP